MSTLEDVPAVAEAIKERSSEDTAENRLQWLVPAAFSLFYFCDVLLRASGKYYWYDELFTVYFARLPSWHALWAALQSGIDFNPPFFYLATRVSQEIFGHGQIATRLPEILGFWIFCLCLFYFTSRRAGPVGGFIAMTFPMVTQAYYWAYEARPHGVVIGFCGLALLCWQRATESGVTRKKWLFSFSLCLLAACLMHCFAITLLIPFSLIEIYRTARRRRVEGMTWVALLTPAIVVTPLYIPLLRSYKTLSDVTNFPEVAPAGWTQFEHFYLFLCKDCILVVLAALLLFATDIYGRRTNASAGGARTEAPREDFLLAIAFLSLPLFGIAVGKLVHGPFFNRYFLGALAGLCIVMGMGGGLRNGRRWVALSLSVVLSLTACSNFGRLLVARARGGGEALVQPDSQFLLDTTPGRPLLFHSLLTSADGSRAIAVLGPLDFLYLVEYAPQLRDRLYFVSNSVRDFTYVGFARLLETCPIQFQRPLTIEQFTRLHPRSLLYGDPSNFKQVAELSDFGTHVGKMQVREGHFLASVDAN